MLKLRSVLSIIIVAVVLAACQKEYSSEDGLGIGTSSGTAIFTLNGAPNTCTGAELNGTYKAGVALTAENTVIVTVNVSNAGTYIITTNSLNGISFAGSGTFTTTGLQTILLRGRGTPAIQGSYNFIPGVNGCAFSVTVESNGGSAGGSAVFSLNGAPGNCAGAAVNGSYVASTPLDATNKIIIVANVTTIGTYNISTTANNGISFSGSGTFTATGIQQVELAGSGTPAGTGDFNFTPGTNGCVFTVKVTSTVPSCKNCSFIPTCAGIKYTFQDVNFTGTSERLADILTVKDTTIDGQPYTKVSTQGGSNYYNCNAGVTTIVGYSPIEIKLTMLEANASAGATWTDVILNQIGQEVTYEYNIAEKGITRDVLGVTFTDVIHVNMKTSLLGILTNVSDFYYANGIGLVEAVTRDAGGTVISTSSLKSYLIP